MNRATENALFRERENRKQRMFGSASGNAMLPITCSFLLLQIA
jgi:hypothetical protein